MSKSTWTPSAVKQAYNSNPDAGHFFDRETMRFLGDRMTSYACTECAGEHYMYRKPTAIVNVFGSHKLAGREYFNCWLISDVDGRVDLGHCNPDQTEQVWQALTGGAA